VGPNSKEKVQFVLKSVKKKCGKYIKQNKKKMSKPPIGLKPKKYHSLERLNEVRSAIVRYYDDELPIPVEWIEEYNELINQNKDENKHT
jgi:hypothetical protein